MPHTIIPYPDQTMNPPVDMNDPEAASTAIELQLPETFSDRAKKVFQYLDGTAFLYQYKGQFVVTDESLYLTAHGDGTPTAPLGFPRFVGETLEDVESWLEAVADEYDEDGNIPGWKEMDS